MKLIEICRGKHFVKDGKLYTLFRVVKIAGEFIELECGWHNQPNDATYCTMYVKEWLTIPVEEFLELNFYNYIDEALERLKSDLSPRPKR